MTKIRKGIRNAISIFRHPSSLKTERSLLILHRRKHYLREFRKAVAHVYKCAATGIAALCAIVSGMRHMGGNDGAECGGGPSCFFEKILPGCVLIK